MLLAISFRREAGSHGKDVKGLIRVHEFFKLEQVVCAKPTIRNRSNGTNGSIETRKNLWRSLKIPYRTVINCGGDGAQALRKMT